VVNRLGSSWVLYQRVVALPKAMCLLMKFHFDFDALVYGLNHTSIYTCAKASGQDEVT